MKSNTVLNFSRYVLDSEHMKKFFDYIQIPDFNIASDAFRTYKMTRWCTCQIEKGDKFAK